MNDFHALYRVDIGMHIANLDPVLIEVFRQVFRHALGQGGDQDSIPHFCAFVDLGQQIVDLGRRRPNFHHRVDQPGGPHHLLDNLIGMFLLIGSRRGRHKYRLRHQSLPLIEAQRSVIQGRGQAKAVVHQSFLARSISFIHSAQLRDSGMGLIDNHQRIARQVIEQGRRWRTGVAAGQVARVIFDTRAIT